MNTIYKNATEAFENLYAFIMSKGINTNVGTKAIYNVNPKYTQNQYVSTRFMKKYYECTLKYSIKIHLI